MVLVSKSQQVAPLSRRTFEVRTLHDSRLSNGEEVAAVIRAVYLDGLREMGRDEPDLIKALYFALQDNVELEPTDEQLLQQAMAPWEKRLAGEAAVAFADRKVTVSIHSKLPTARTGERNRAQVEALVLIDRYGLKYDEGYHSAYVDQYRNPAGVFRINVATVRALVKQRDIEKAGSPEYMGDKDEPEQDEVGNIAWHKRSIYDFQRWRLTTQGRRLMELGIKRYQEADE